MRCVIFYILFQIYSFVINQGAHIIFYNNISWYSNMINRPNFWGRCWHQRDEPKHNFPNYTEKGQGHCKAKDNMLTVSEQTDWISERMAMI